MFEGAIKVKFKKQSVLLLALLLASVFIIPNFVSIIGLILTDVKIVPIYFTPFYFAKITSQEYDENVFVGYMKDKGWERWERNGGELIFYKNNEEYRILGSQIKTVIYDGKLIFFKM